MPQTGGIPYDADMTERSILFVCTGNVFRSVAAEYGFKKYLADNKIAGWKVGSAGVVADPAVVDPETLRELAELGIDASAHQQRKLTRELLEGYDAVVGMAEDHLAFMKAYFDYNDALLFNDLAAEEQSSIWDIEDEVADHATNRRAVETFIDHTVSSIVGKMPGVYKNANERFYLFSDFVAGRVAHRNGYPFITLHETPNTIAFMSIDIPSKEDGHILVIPKRRYADLAHIPDELLTELLAAVKKVGQALRENHDGYNLLLNNGREAGQYMMHSHFHIIPRRAGDDIRVEGWDHPKIRKEDFVALNERLKRQIAAAG